MIKFISFVGIVGFGFAVGYFVRYLLKMAGS